MPTQIAVRPAYRPFQVEVRRVEKLSPHFTRVTFTADDLEHFGTARRDQRIKVVLPHADGTYADLGQDDEAGEWYARWRALPAAERNAFRTYTVRRIDPEARELDVDFVTHHGAGPAGAWAEAATPGKSLIVVGPDERSPHSATGIDWHPGTARRVLLAGDETAAPAIAAILEGLDGDVDADAFVEVPTRADALPVRCTRGVRLTWLAREQRPHGAALIDAVGGWLADNGTVVARAAAPRRQDVADIDIDRELLWESPGDADGEFYAWIAGEAAMVKTIRRILVRDHGVDRARVAFMGYWRRGQAERTE